MTNSTKFKTIIKYSIFLLTFSLIYTMYANSGGNTGKSESNSGGCSCHGTSNSNTKVTATVDGGLTFEPGEEKTITINVENSGKTAAGMNASVKTQQTGGTNAGSLKAGTGTKVQSNEITHTSPKNFSGDNTDFTFDWEAPQEPGEYYLLAIGNAVDGTGGTGNDHYDWMDPVKITVLGLNLTSLTGGQDFCAGETVNITWDGFGVSNVKIELSSDGGQNYDETLVASTGGSSWEWQIPNSIAQGNQYRIKISDASNANISSESSSNISISSGVEITAQPAASTTICTGETLELSVTATGNNLSYQWKKDGNNMNGETNSTLSISNIGTTAAGIYTCDISSDCGSASTESAEVNVNESPVITSFPSSRAVCIGRTLSIEVEATGSGLTYQWQKDGNDIAGETTSLLEISDVMPTDAGQYTVIVTSDNCGSIVSDESNVIILEEPEITMQTQVSSSRCENGTVSIWIDATGPSVSYQWQKNAEDIPNTNSKTLTIENYSQTDFANYRCVVSNNCESINSEIVVLDNIDDLPEIVTHPNGRNTFTGSNFTISVVASGTNLSYAWYKDGDLIADETGPDLQFLNTALIDAGDYYCEVTNDCGSVNSEIATITVEEQGDGPVLVLSQNEIDFGDVEVGTIEKLLFEDFIVNSGDQPLFISKVELSDLVGGVFAMNEVTASSVQPSESRDLLVEFAPDSEGNFATTLIIETGHDDNRTINIKGNGIQAGEAALISDVSIVDFGELEIGKESTGTINLTNSSNSEIATITNISFENETEDFLVPDSDFLPIGIDQNTTFPLDVILRPSGDNLGEISNKLIIEAEYSGNSQILEIDLQAEILEPKSVKEAASNVAAYPIPTQGKINFEIETKEIGSFKVKIINSNGELVKDLGSKFSNSNRLDLNWNGFDSNGSIVESGTYFLVIEGNDSMSQIKFVLNK